MKSVKSLFSVALILLLAGCSSHQMAIKYQPTATVQKTEISAPAIVGNVADMRGEDPTWIGTIRGGYGNPLKKLYAQTTTTQVVADAFTEALKARNWLGAEDTAEYRFDIEVLKFHANYYFNKQAYAHFAVTVVHEPSNNSVFSKTYTTDNKRGGAGAGIFADAEALGAFANETLNENIDKALSDPALIDALGKQRSSPAANSTLESKLNHIGKLKEDGVITAEEYKRMRADIIEDY